MGWYCRHCRTPMGRAGKAGEVCVCACCGHVLVQTEDGYRAASLMDIGYMSGKLRAWVRAEVSKVYVPASPKWPRS
jgi:hypothetical protein